MLNVTLRFTTYIAECTAKFECSPPYGMLAGFMIWVKLVYLSLLILHLTPLQQPPSPLPKSGTIPPSLSKCLWTNTRNWKTPNVNKHTRATFSWTYSLSLCERKLPVTKLTLISWAISAIKRNMIKIKVKMSSLLLPLHIYSVHSAVENRRILELSSATALHPEAWDH